MKVTNEQYLIFSGLFHLAIAATYALICISNYSFDWLDYEFVKIFGESEILKIKSERTYDPDLTWGLAGFNGIMFLVNWVIWRENETVKKPNFKSETFGVGVIPFCIAITLYMVIDYRNDLIFAITGSYATINIALFTTYEIRDWRQAKQTPLK